MRQKGFTLIEVLVVMAVGGVVMMGIVASIFQVATGTSRSNSQGIVLTDVNRAAWHITKDLQMANSTGITVDDSVVLSPGTTATLRWTDFTSAFEPEGAEKNHSSAYSLTDSGELVRTYDGTVNIVGRHITSLRFTQQKEWVVNVVITSTGPTTQQRSKTLEFSVHMRSGGMPE